MPILYKKGSDPISVSSNEAYQAAIKDGYALKDGTEAVAVTDRTGEAMEVSPDQVGSFMQQGSNFADPSIGQQSRISQENQNEHGGTADRIRAFGENALDAATLGGYSVAANVFDGDEGMRKRREANPGTAMAGSLVGAIGPALLPGGQGGLAGKIVRNTPAGLAAKAGAKVGAKVGTGTKAAIAAGATEAAIHGAGAGISNLAINDVPLSVESVVSEVGLNALLGGGLGGVAGGIGAGLVKGGQKLTKRAQSMEARAVAETVDLSQDTLQSMQKTSAAAFKELDALAPNVLKKAEQHAKGFVDGVDEVAFTNARNVIDDIARSSKAKATNLGKHGRQVKAVEKASADLLESSTEEATKKAFRKYQEATRQLSHAVGTPNASLSTLRITSRRALEVPEGLDDLLKAARGSQKAVTGLSDDPVKALMKTESVDDMMKLAGDLKDYGKNMKALDDALGGTFGAQFDETLNKLAAQATEVVGPQAAKLDLVSMGVLFGVEEALIPDLPGPIDELVKLALAAKFAGQFSKATSKAGGLFKSVTGQAAKRAAGTAAFKSGGGGSVAGAAKAAVAEGLVSRAVNAAWAGTRNIHAATGKATTRITKALGKLGKRSGKAVKNTSRAAGAVLRDTDYMDEGVPKKETEEQAFKRVTHQVARMASDPRALAKRISDNALPLRMGNAAVGDQMTAHLQNVVQFLNAHMPRDPGTLKHFGKSKWRATKYERNQFAKLVSAVNDPVGAVERLAAGTMNRQDALALREVHPAVFQKVQNHLIENLDQLQKYPYRQRIQISTLMGIDADPVVSRTKEWQQHFQEDAGQQGGLQKPSGSTAPSDPDTLAQQLSAPRAL